MTQEQREAVVDLLLLGMFADAPLRVSEDQKLLSVIEEIGWESYQAPDLYLQSAIAKARDATDTEGGIKHRLEKIGQELNDTDAAAVVTYIRTAWGNHGQPVTSREVNELRKAPLH